MEKGKKKLTLAGEQEIFTFSDKNKNVLISIARKIDRISNGNKEVKRQYLQYLKNFLN